jgi:hypothetical protein
VGPGSQAGFLDFPSGAFTPDPTAPPNAKYYDRAVSRWLPVARSEVAPDGRHYAYTTGGIFSATPEPPRLHVVDAATDAERVIDLSPLDQQPAGEPRHPNAYAVEDYAADWIYIQTGGEGASSWHWRVDPASGIITDLGYMRGHDVDDGTGHAWVSVFDSRDPHPALSALDGSPMANEVVRRNLRTGADEVWFYQPGFMVGLVGAFVGGGLLVWVESHEYWLVTTPRTSRLIATIDFADHEGLADSHGLWLGSGSSVVHPGLYLFARDGTIKRVSDLLGRPANGCL